MKHLKIVLILIISISLFSNSQNTVGIISNSLNAFNGYTLFTAQTETYLIDNCGRVINQWTSLYPPGNSVYLLKNGNLLRAAKIENMDIDFGGTGGRIEMFNWNGDIIWQYEYNTDQYRQHHDIYPMPNGNILMLAVTVMSNFEAINSGRNPSNLSESVLYNEQILELEPTGFNTANIVWEWNIKDHLIQEYDSSKDNYGIIANNPQLLDINYLGGSLGNANWMHVNSIQYSEELDQIVISSRLLNEFYIIDHSTTTEQASSHSGGVYGKGGDILYRWGNPQVYNQGDTSDQKLFGQHFPHFIPNSLLDAGKIILFNNGFNRDPDFSEVFIIEPPTSSPGFYIYDNNAYGPIEPEYIYVNPSNPEDFYSAILSGAQRLANGNILICEGTSGRFFEVDTNGDLVWEYISPVGPNKIFKQGEAPLGNSVFRAFKYAVSYPAFTGKDMSPGNTIELGTDVNSCTTLSKKNNSLSIISLYPNPTKGIIHFKSLNSIVKIEIYNILAERLMKIEKQNINQIHVEHLKSGLYFLNLYNGNQVIKKRFLKI